MKNSTAAYRTFKPSYKGRPGAVIFDLDDVIAAYDRVAHIAHIAALARCAADHVFQEIWASGYDARADSGEFDADTYLAGFLPAIGYRLTRKEWLTGRAMTTFPNADVLAIMHQLRPHTRLAILTNNTTLVRDYLGILVPDLETIVDGRVFVSADARSIKPDREIFEWCAARLGVAVDSAVFIDDRLENVDGAVQAGLAGHVFVSASPLAAFLRTHNFEIR